MNAKKVTKAAKTTASTFRDYQVTKIQTKRKGKKKKKK